MGGPLTLDGRRLMGGRNNHPKVVVNGEGGIRVETRPGRNVWGLLSHCLGRRMEASNEKKRPTSSAEAPGGGAAQNIKAVSLDRGRAPPWCCSLLDGCCLE